MIVNRHNLNTLYVAFSAAFASALSAGEAQALYTQIATVVPSTTRSNEYGWLGKIPGMREWIGDRVVHGLMAHGYSIRNKPYELTVGVDRDDVEDDNLGIYTPLMSEMGSSAAIHPDQLSFSLLAAGTSTPCYDGQNFFDTDHPVLAADGSETTQSNDLGGGGTPWYLLCTNRALKPLIFQRRQAPKFVSMDTETDEGVFSKKEFRYGVDGRHNVGFGFWQMAIRSAQTLDATNLQAAFTAMEGRLGDHGQPLNIKPNLLVVPSTLRWKALELLQTQRNAAGADNIMKDAADLLVSPYLG